MKQKYINAIETFINNRMWKIVDMIFWQIGKDIK